MLLFLKNIQLFKGKLYFDHLGHLYRPEIFLFTNELKTKEKDNFKRH